MALPLAITMGEPAGIGPDILLRAWHDGRATLPAFAVLADPAFLASRARRLGLDCPVVETDWNGVADAFHKGLPVIPLSATVTDRPGQPDSQTAPLVIEAIEQGVAAIHQGKASAIITNPIAKSVLAAAGFAHPGHTEFLGVLAERWGQGPVRPVMLLWSDVLSVVPVTIHMPLRDVPVRLTTALIVETAVIVDHDYRRRFGIKRPRLALCGLNPHAGEDGLLGREDGEVIVPAVQQLQAMGIAASGPFPADTMFHERARQTYDVALGMYHDQVLVPMKTLAFDDGVNATLGLPFIRTSPDHGTAFSLAGTGQARPDSLVAAIRLAARLAERD